MSSSVGTGASRRSHTKSRKGCKTCKRRHIRCDETFPQCRNCAKHQVRCDYMDLVATEDAPRGPPVPDLYWSPEIDSILEHWQRLGYCVLGDFSINLHAGDHTYSKSDLHLMYHALWSGSHNMTNEFTVWTGKTPRFLEVATSQPFLVHAILGFGSLAVAWERNSTDAKALAYQHGATALQGLQRAIGSFSRENADAVLAASILLSWQANDWRSWASLVTGIRTLTRSMQSWRDQSMLTRILDEQEYSIPHSFPELSTSPMIEEARRNHGNVLQQIYLSLETLHPHLVNRADGNHIEQLKDYIQRLLSVRPAQTPEEEFNHLYAFRKWLFWIPATLLRSESRDYMTLVVLAYFYATALSFESIYPTVASAFCSTMALKPLEEILQSFEAMEQSTAFYSQGRNNVLQLLDWPRQVAAAYRQQKSATSMQSTSMSPPAFEMMTSDLANVYNEHGFGSQPSPAFVPSPKRRVSSDLSSHGSPYLELPTLAGSSSNFGGTYQQHSLALPSMSAGFDLDDSYGVKSQMDWSGFVNSPLLWT